MRKKLFLFCIFVLFTFSGCSSSSKARGQSLSIISVGWSDDRHLAYIANPLLPNGNASGIFELHIVELAQNSSQIIKDTTLTSALGYPYSPIAYCHTLQQVYMPVKNSILMWDIKEGRTKNFAMHLPNKFDIQRIYAQPESTMVYCTKSDYRKDYNGDFFWWLVWMDLANGEILFDTYDCFSPFGFFLENGKKSLHYVELDTIKNTAFTDTSAKAISLPKKRLRPSEYTIEEIQAHYRNQWYSPSLKYTATDSKLGLKIENSGI